MSTYILQKDLPEAKAGTEYRNIMGVLCYKTDLVIPDCTHPDAPSFTKSILSFDVRRKIYLDDQEWFKLKEDRIEVKNFIQTCGIGISDIRYQFELKGEIDKKDYNKIKRAIEFVLNDGYENFYTVEDMYKCFIAGHNNGIKTVPRGMDQAAAQYVESLNK